MKADLICSEGSNSLSEIKVGFVELKKEMSELRKSISKLEQEMYRDHLAKMTALVYQKIKFVYNGHEVNNFNDLCALRDELSTAKGPDSGLENAVVKWALDFLGEPSPSPKKLGLAFKKLCLQPKAYRNSGIHHKPNLKDVLDAIDFLCSKSGRIDDEERVYIKYYFGKFAEKVCGVDQDDDDLFGDI